MQRVSRRKPAHALTQAALWPPPPRGLVRLAAATGQRLSRATAGGSGAVTGRPARTPALDPVLAILAAAPAVTRLLGPLAFAPGPDVPAWAELDRTGARPLLRLHAKALAIAGDRIVRQADGRGRVTACSLTTGVQRWFSLDDLRRAAAAAQDALSAAGVGLSYFCEVRATPTGGVAT
ncbi:MAG: hypothetical protein NW200_03955, partial [Hyphomonadaceae bacterium]|nr:hypothetical protein [Hyphomonadaceae bacterium]